MNREQRRVAARARLQPIDWRAHPEHRCATVAIIATLIEDCDPGWLVEHPPCDRCGQYTIVHHHGAGVFACLSCGLHGKSGTPGEHHT